MFDIDASKLQVSGISMKSSDISPGTFFIELGNEGCRNGLFQHVGYHKLSSCDKAQDIGTEKVLISVYNMEKPTKAIKLHTAYKDFIFNNIVIVNVDIQVSFTKIEYVMPKVLGNITNMFALHSRDGLLELVTRGDDWNEFGKYVSVTRSESFDFPEEGVNRVVPVDVKFIVSNI